MDDADFRIRLEGRAERLEVALLRYRALEQFLTGFRWKSKLLGQSALMLETAAAADEVRQTADAVQRRAAAEQWPAGLAVVRVAEQVAALDVRLQDWCAKRLRAAVRPLSVALGELEARVVASPRLIFPHERWSAARSLLPYSLADVRLARQFAARVEALFKRPFRPMSALPFTAEELESVAGGWGAGSAAVERLWGRVSKADLAGTLTRFLKRRSRRSPLKSPVDGAEVLLHAEFWRGVALARLGELVSTRLSPLSCPEALLWHVALWLTRKEQGGSAVLPVVPGLPRPRAALYELASALVSTPKPRLGWEGLLRLAAEADALPGDDADLCAMQDNLRVLVRVVSRSDNRRPLERTLGSERPAAVAESEPRSLSGLIGALRDRA